MTPPAARADAHIHLFRDGFLTDGRDEVAWYEELRAAAGVGHALVVGYEGAERFAGNNTHILDLSRRLDWVHPTAYVDVTAPPPADALRQLRHAGFAGWSAYLPENGPTLSHWSADRLAALAGGILSVNATPAALAAAASAIDALGDTAVLVSHIGLPGAAARGADRATARERLAPLLALADRPQVSVKLSGLYAIDPQYPHPGAAEAVRAVLEAFGPHRIVWGSDFSPATSEVAPAEAMRLPDWISEGLSPDEAAAILGGTLLRHLALTDRIGGTQP